jgi:type IX secretion system PorP/SprF family membrane protein
MMRKGILFSLLFFVQALHAQFRPHYTQYILNNYIVNPALTGIENYVDVKMSMRNQWLGIDGAPKTFYATAHGALGKGDYRQNATSFDMIGQNTRGNEFLPNYTTASPHHGIGFTALNYKTGYINRVTSYATYAYHIGLNETTSLSAGFGLGITSFSIDRSKVTLATSSDPSVDETIATFRKIKPEMNAGLWLYSNKYFIGLSAQQIIPSKLSLIDNAENKSTLVPHLFATAGYRARLSYDVSVIPSVMVRYISNLPIGVDLNLKAQFQDLFWIGGGYRNQDGFAAMLGLNFAQKIHISYAYDLNKGQYLLSTMNRGTHEIVVGFLLKNRHPSL